MLQLTYTAAQALAASLTANVVGGNYSGPFNGSFLMLFTAATRSDDQATVADLTESNFTGYARVPLTPLGAAYLTADGRWSRDFQAANFAATDDAHPNAIMGYGIVSAAVGGNLLAIEVFQAPVMVGAAGQGFTIMPRIELPPAADWGEAAVNV